MKRQKRRQKDFPSAHQTPAIKPRTAAQSHYLQSIRSNIITFGVGPAGTGKSYIAAAAAAEALDQGNIRKIYITRPGVEAEEEWGHLPGDLDQKFEPYLRPLRDIFEECLGYGRVEYLLKSKAIEAAPLGFLRGRTLKDCFVILDEAQNTTPKQMLLFLTRIGEYSTYIINGDESQKDIPGQSGLEDARRRLQGLPGIGCVEFQKEDIVRHGLIKDILARYEEPVSALCHAHTRTSANNDKSTEGWPVSL